MSRVVRSRWCPPVLCAITACIVLLLHGVGFVDVMRYSLWLVWCVALPGTLVWRALRGGAHSFVEDVACGAALGYALQILLYIGLRAIGAPMLVLGWPAIVIGAFVLAPSLRTHWRPSAIQSVPVAWSWAVAACVLILILWLTGVFFRTHPLSGAVAGRPYVDFPYHLAVAGEVKHHVPPTWPYIHGERLHHHWFSHAEAAASSWATGLELRLILLRLQILPHVALGIVLTALLGTRLAKRWWPGPVAVVIAYFVSSFSAYGWSSTGVFKDFKLLEHFQWQAPTQTVALSVFAPVPILLLDRFRREPGATGGWLLITILLAATMGSKSSTLPVYLIGMGIAGGVHLLRTRRILPTALIGGLIGSALFIVGYLVLFGGDSYGLRWEALGYARRLDVVSQTGLDARRIGLGTLTVIGLLAAASWLWRGIGAFGIGAARPGEGDRSAAFLAGTMLGAVPLVLFTTHPGGSNVNFIRSAYPMFGALAAAGLAALVPRSRESARLTALAIAAVAGAALAWALARQTGTPPVSASPTSVTGVVGTLMKPFVAVVVMALAMAIATGLLGRNIRFLRGLGAAVALAAITGSGLPNTVHTLSKALHPDSAEYFTLQSGVRSIPQGAIPSARWLRDHSSADDVVATNTHCRFISQAGQCDNRHFWIAAYTERRVLVEGWGYTAFSMRPEGGSYYGPFPDQTRLHDNDAAFQRPSSATMNRLRAYGVRWLFVDERYDTPAPTLPAFARLRYRSGECLVYEI